MSLWTKLDGLVPTALFVGIRARSHPGLWAWEGGDWLLRGESPTPTSYLLNRLIRKGTYMYPWFPRFDPEYISVWVSETAPLNYPDLHSHNVIVFCSFFAVFSPSFFPFPFSSFPCFRVLFSSSWCPYTCRESPASTSLMLGLQVCTTCHL